MLSQTIKIALRNWTYYVLIIVAGLAVFTFDEINEESSSASSTLIMWIILALCVHYAVLFDGNFADVGKKDRNFRKLFVPFLFKALALGLIGFVVSLPILFITLARSSAPLASSSAPTLPILLFTLCMLVIYALVLAIAGTWLPASVYGLRTSFGEAVKRGRPVFLSAFGHLLAGIVLSPILSIAALMAGSAALSSATIMIDGRPNIPFILVLAINLLIQALGVTYVAVVLSKIYIAREKILPIENGIPRATVT